MLFLYKPVVLGFGEISLLNFILSEKKLKITFLCALDIAIAFPNFPANTYFMSAKKSKQNLIGIIHKALLGFKFLRIK